MQTISDQAKVVTEKLATRSDKDWSEWAFAWREMSDDAAWYVPRVRKTQKDDLEWIVAEFYFCGFVGDVVGSQFTVVSLNLNFFSKDVSPYCVNVPVPQIFPKVYFLLSEEI